MLWYQRLYSDVKISLDCPPDSEAVYIRYDDRETLLTTLPYGTLFSRCLDADIEGINLPHLQSRTVWLSESLGRPVESVAYAKIADAIANSLMERHPFIEPVLLRLGEMIRLTNAGDPTAPLREEAKGRFLEAAQDVIAATEKLIALRRRLLSLLDSGIVAELQDSLEAGGDTYYGALSGQEGALLPLLPPEIRHIALVSPETPLLEVVEPGISSDGLIGAYLRDVLTGRARIRQCENCGSYFIQRKKYNYLYCDRPAGGDRTCRQIGAVEKHRLKVEGSPMLAEYRRTYHRLFSRIRTGAMEKSVFQAWQAQAKSRMRRVESGKLSLDDFLAWLSRQ